MKRLLALCADGLRRRGRGLHEPRRDQAGPHLHAAVHVGSGERHLQPALHGAAVRQRHDREDDDGRHDLPAARAAVRRRSGAELPDPAGVRRVHLQLVVEPDPACDRRDGGDRRSPGGQGRELPRRDEQLPRERRRRLHGVQRRNRPARRRDRPRRPGQLLHEQLPGGTRTAEPHHARPEGRRERNDRARPGKRPASAPSGRPRRKAARRRRGRRPWPSRLRRR
jgi:hypothetical protein